MPSPVPSPGTGTAPAGTAVAAVEPTRDVGAGSPIVPIQEWVIPESVSTLKMEQHPKMAAPSYPWHRLTIAPSFQKRTDQDDADVA